jgi:hypothetical protein
VAAAHPRNDLKMLTRQSLRGGAGEQGFVMPPGFVEESRARRQVGPLAFAAIGMCVMVLSYLALLAFNPFK